MYYEDLLEIVEAEKRVLDGQEVKRLFIRKYGSGSIINMNKALRKLRHDKKLYFFKDGRRLYYWSLSQKKIKIAEYLIANKKTNLAINI